MSGEKAVMSAAIRNLQSEYGSLRSETRTLRVRKGIKQKTITQILRNWRAESKTASLSIENLHQQLQETYELLVVKEITLNGVRRSRDAFETSWIVGGYHL